jgi:phosphate transport system substrate-binding protein
MSKFLKIMAMILVLTVALSAIGCSGDSGTLTLAGSTTVEPLAKKWADTYEAANSGVSISVQGGGSSAGVKGAAMETADIGMASREMKDSEKTEFPSLITHHVAADGVAVVVHPSSSVSNLSLSEIQAIFAAGSDDTWTLINREEGSGTREVFEDNVMDGTEVGADAEYLASNGACKQKIASTENAIGYISLGYVDSSVKAITIDNVVCSPDTCLDGSYPISRFLNFITMGEPEGLAKKFLDYCMSAEGQSIVAEEGYISIA